MPWWLVHFHRSGRSRSISCRDCEPADAGPDGWMRADVMRGAECKTLEALAELTRRGLLEPGQEGLVFVWPGSHSKLVEVDGQGRITRSQTTLAGELIDPVGCPPHVGALAVVLVSIDPGRQSDRSTVTEPAP